jgi:hypothetical protein
VLALRGGQVECLWDEVVAIQARELPEDLVRLDRVLCDVVLLEPIAAVWEQSARERGRPSISMESFVRLMIIKAAHWLGLRDACAGGLRLAAPAALLPDRARSACAGGVDGAQARPPAGRRGRGGDRGGGDR